MEITLLLNNPPGRRCRLYRTYAAVITAHSGAASCEVFGALPSRPELQAPALLIDGRPVIPSTDGVLSPGDLLAILAAIPSDTTGLETALNQCIEEWH